MRRLPVRLLALIVALGMVVPATAIAHVLYECRMMGTVSASCCCSSEQRTEQDEGVRVEAGDCCDANFVSPEHHPASPSSSALGDVPAAAVLSSLPALYSADHPVGFSSRKPNRARGPPANGPPVYIQHCALLN